VNQNKNFKIRTRLKHIYYKFKRDVLNLRLSFFSYYKYLKLKQNKGNLETNLKNYYKKNKISILEGNSLQSEEQEKYLKSLEGNFKNILEIGFNAGHSSELFLENFKNAKVTSVDLGYWYYCKFGYEFLKNKYPGRIEVHFEDSIKALKGYSKLNKNNIYDLIYIDGNHTYQYALNDILNCKKFSDQSTILLLDDVVQDPAFRTEANKAPTEVWNKLKEEGVISEIECMHFKDINRGVAVGRYTLAWLKEVKYKENKL